MSAAQYKIFFLLPVRHREDYANLKVYLDKMEWMVAFHYFVAEIHIEWIVENTHEIHVRLLEEFFIKSMINFDKEFIS